MLVGQNWLCGITKMRWGDITSKLDKLGIEYERFYKDKSVYLRDEHDITWQLSALARWQGLIKLHILVPLLNPTLSHICFRRLKWRKSIAQCDIIKVKKYIYAFKLPLALTLEGIEYKERVGGSTYLLKFFLMFIRDLATSCGPAQVIKQHTSKNTIFCCSFLPYDLKQPLSTLSVRLLKDIYHSSSLDFSEQAQVIWQPKIIRQQLYDNIWLLCSTMGFSVNAVSPLITHKDYKRSIPLKNTGYALSKDYYYFLHHALKQFTLNKQRPLCIRTAYSTLKPLQEHKVIIGCAPSVTVRSAVAAIRTLYTYYRGSDIVENIKVYEAPEVYQVSDIWLFIIVL